VSRSTHAPLIRKIDCLQLPVGDLEAGVAFYERLGHEVLWRRPNQVGLRLPDTDAELVLQTERPDARVESSSIRFRSRSDSAPSSPTRMETSSSCST
jgi:catechol 2,3-dioxygenase-like lactoylglutathione lyase family enzyme